MRKPALTMGCLLIFGLGFGSGMLVGLLLGEGGTYHRRYLEERDALIPWIADDPSFSRVEIEERSDGGVYLIGSVSSREELDRLQSIVARVLGEPRGEDAMVPVIVE